ncbi:hypothetical protein BKA67DRAFT_310997 [Truncatella angustata]|uniref:Uncharacterized protein n=1 Tax=Truncatella angustata TaxID=152316 RepID=A0A9P8UJC8_9PEZI|nr:uncharacterized protein BKA67DRAFT_310997 [Truncatella angustata]KAH6653181.1 hypothetical protein BKA67DRAFT_310997 [Truncatella angustata]
MMGSTAGIFGLGLFGFALIGLAVGLPLALRRHDDDKNDGKNEQKTNEAIVQAMKALEKAKDDPHYLVQELKDRPEYGNFTQRLYTYTPQILMGYENVESIGSGRFASVMKVLMDSDLALQVMTSRSAMQMSLDLLCTQEGPEVCKRLNAISDAVAGRDTTDDPICK